jgi:hypothetical protein
MPGSAAEDTSYRKPCAPHESEPRQCLVRILGAGRIKATVFAQHRGKEHLIRPYEQQAEEDQRVTDPPGPPPNSHQATDL